MSDFEFKGTKGEWKVDEYDKRTIRSIDNDNYAIATANYYPPIASNEKEAQANAKLIAASPDLLESLQNLLYLGERMEQESGELDATVERAGLAIKKAIL